MKLDIEGLEEKARKATHGPWECSDLGPTLLERPKKKDIQVDSWDDAAHIAACSPEIILELIRQHKLMKESLEFYVDQKNYEDGPDDGCMVWIMEDLGKRAEEALKELE